MTAEVARSSVALVRQRLGAASGRLYGALLEAQEGAIDHDVATLRPVMVSVLCGDYHDYRGTSDNPKRKLIADLNEFMPHGGVHIGGRQEVATGIYFELFRIAQDVDRGHYDEDADEGRRAALEAGGPKLNTTEVGLLIGMPRIKAGIVLRHLVSLGLVKQLKEIDRWIPARARRR